MTRRRPNPLLARPPKARHRLLEQYRGWWEERAGRPLTEDLYEGVHTTTWPALAALYAQQAAQAEIDAGPTGGLGPGDPYPVVLVLDVRGLHPLPDVDSLATNRARFRDGMMMAALGLALKERVATSDLLGMPERPGSPPHPEQAHLVSIWFGRQAQRSTIWAIYRAMRARGDKAVRAAWLRWTRTGMVPDEVLPWSQDQFRYPDDLDRRRLVAVVATRPFHPYARKNESEVEQRRSEDLARAGWTIFTPEDLAPRAEGDHWVYRRVPGRALWTNPRLARLDWLDPHRVQLHGTSSTAARAAFPDIPLPASAPFPVRRGAP